MWNLTEMQYEFSWQICENDLCVTWRHVPYFILLQLLNYVLECRRWRNLCRINNMLLLHYSFKCHRRFCFLSTIQVMKLLYTWNRSSTYVLPHYIYLGQWFHWSLSFYTRFRSDNVSFCITSNLIRRPSIQYVNCWCKICILPKSRIRILHFQTITIQITFWLMRHIALISCMILWRTLIFTCHYNRKHIMMRFRWQHIEMTGYYLSFMCVNRTIIEEKESCVRTSKRISHIRQTYLEQLSQCSNYTNYTVPINVQKKKRRKGSETLRIHEWPSVSESWRRNLWFDRMCYLTIQSNHRQILKNMESNRNFILCKSWLKIQI